MAARPPLRVGIISAAWGARAHLPAWRSLDGIEVTAICTSRPETAARAAQDFGVARAFHDFRAMAADPDIDIVDCGTRPPLRYAMVMAALSAGKHVYTGIPFAKDLADARAMTAARRAAGTVGVVDAAAPCVGATDAGRGELVQDRRRRVSLFGVGIERASRSARTGVSDGA